jgi:hypothetical protein
VEISLRPPGKTTRIAQSSARIMRKNRLFGLFALPMAPLLPLPSETSAHPTDSSEKNLHLLPVFLEEGLTAVAGDRNSRWQPC